MFLVCSLLYIFKCFLSVLCCTDSSVSCVFFVVQIQVFPVCSLLYRLMCFLSVLSCTDLSVWSEASQDIQRSLLQHFRELLVAGV